MAVDYTKVADTMEYSPKLFGELWVKAMEKAGSLAEFAGIVIPNVVDSVSIPVFNGAVDPVLKEDNLDCEFTPGDEKTEVVEKEFKIRRKKVNETQCIEKLNVLRSKGIWNGGFEDFENTDLYDVMIEDIVRRLAIDMNAEAFGTGENSVVTRALADGDTIKIEATTLTKANIVDELEKIYEAMTPEMTLEGVYTDDFKPEFIVNAKTFKLAKMALTLAPTDVNVQLPKLTFEGTGANMKVYFMGIEIKVNNALGDNVIFVTHTGNLALVGDMLDDAKSIKAGRFPAPEENKLYFKTQFGYEFDYIDPEQVIIYA